MSNGGYAGVVCETQICDSRCGYHTLYQRGLGRFSTCHGTARRTCDIHVPLYRRRDRAHCRDTPRTDSCLLTMDGREVR